MSPLDIGYDDIEGKNQDFSYERNLRMKNEMQKKKTERIYETGRNKNDFPKIEKMKQFQRIKNGVIYKTKNNIIA